MSAAQEQNTDIDFTTFIPLFIIGPPRSGTTLLLDLLSLHPEANTHGTDFHHFHHNLMLFPHRQDELDHYRLTTTDALPSVRSAYEQAIQECIWKNKEGLKNSNYFILKISTLSIQVDYLAALFPQARFIQLVRDGRDTACSLEGLRQALGDKQGHMRDLGAAPDPFGLWCVKHCDNPYLRGFATWFYHVSRSWLNLRFLGSERFRRFRYEDLVINSAAVVSEMLSFMGLSNGEEIKAALNDICDNPTPASAHYLDAIDISKGAIPLGFSTTQATGDKRIGRFKDELSDDIINVTARLISPLMQLLGYTAPHIPSKEEEVKGCQQLGINSALWEEKVNHELKWFIKQKEAFDPVHLLLLKRPLHSQLKPLLIDGAEVSFKAAYSDGDVSVDARSSVAKQSRCFEFPDTSCLWPRIAKELQGEKTIAQLQDIFGLKSVHLLEQLVDRGFVGLL